MCLFVTLTADTLICISYHIIIIMMAIKCHMSICRLCFIGIGIPKQVTAGLGFLFIWCNLFGLG